MGLYEGVIALQNDLDIPLLFLYFFYSFEIVWYVQKRQKKILRKKSFLKILSWLFDLPNA